MTRDEAIELVGCVVRCRATALPSTRNARDVYSRLVAVVGDKAIVKPPGHGRLETYELGDIRRSVKHTGHRQPRRSPA